MSNLGSDEKSIRVRRVLVIARRTALIVLGSLCFCVFASALFGVPQSFVCQWWMKPPRYPGAAPFTYQESWMGHEGTICAMLSPGAYCYEWYYRTADPVEKVITYYETLKWPLHDPIRFEWKRGMRFGMNWVAEDNVRVFSNICGYQIIVHPSPDGDTEIYILERGAMGKHDR